MVFFIDEARSRPPPRLLTNVNKKMVFFIEGFPYNHKKIGQQIATYIVEMCKSKTQI